MGFSNVNPERQRLVAWTKARTIKHGIMAEQDIIVIPASGSLCGDLIVKLQDRHRNVEVHVINYTKGFVDFFVWVDGEQVSAEKSIRIDQ